MGKTHKHERARAIHARTTKRTHDEDGNVVSEETTVKPHKPVKLVVQDNWGGQPQYVNTGGERHGSLHRKWKAEEKVRDRRVERKKKKAAARKEIED